MTRRAKTGLPRHYPPPAHVVTAGEMRALDQAAAERGVPGRVLMENAGSAVARVVLDLTARLDHRPLIVVVCGKGNNGGDGLVVARHLDNQGMTVLAGLLCHASDLSGDAADNYAAALAYGMKVAENWGAEDLRAALAHADIVVDAVLGTGIKGEVRGPAIDAIRAINASSATVVSVDIPSGVNADTGALCGDAVWADITVTLGLPKVGNVTYPGAERCGDLQVADLGLPSDLTGPGGLTTSLVTPELARACLPERGPDIHKGDAGRVLIVAGSRKYAGAAALCVRGALRAGAGLTFLASTQAVADVVSAHSPECIRVPLPETASGALALEAADDLLAAAADCQAVALGPGLGQDSSTQRLIARLVAEIEAPLVLDADGLNAVAAHPDVLASRQPFRTILTPHPGEMARLLGTDLAAVQADRLATAREAANRFGAVVVLKGAGTVVARSDDQAWINPTGNHGLAKGGTGDVLTGILTAFVAGGTALDDAALAGVYYHGLASDRAVEGIDPRSLLATDVAEHLGRAMALD